MNVGILKDIKTGENRVIATPVEVAGLAADGHRVYVQKGAGAKAGFPDEKYAVEGAVLTDTAEEIYKSCDFIAKVKEFEPSEYGLLRENQIVFTCIHPAAHPEEVQALLKKKVIAFTAEDSHRFGSPNCEAAGKQGALMGLESMLTINGGKGKFVSGLGGALGMKVLILGGGTVGQAALSVLHALGAWVTVADISIGTLRRLQNEYRQSIDTVISSRENIKALLPSVDMVLNCVKWPKGSTEYLITREMVRSMEPGSVIVDISNDEQGALETFHETTHENPRYVEEGVVHYCVSNIPGAIANSTSVAYAASVLPHFRSILNNGVAEACARDGYLRRSLTTYKGYLTHEETSALQNRPWIRPEEILGIAGRELDFAPPATVSRSDNFIKLT
ncbi:alanine dehydrogenase [[Clostridium] hylemonae]|uniref:alanine dehydrogenase n=1 Tax=[Clostridium] hylemonae DSM 15053 TaxID=553973 RepID=C0C4P5_9FIRM|nr:alanine dehydrogenase [[Clostridium] hylemonae]EEG73038.1 putative alanine dehydrogenase [[Clostridium] hylemonae DSM 15053]QEK16218.1 Alanine dehydrogenase [[Clostridium] hylemonae DSM 15053]